MAMCIMYVMYQRKINRLKFSHNLFNVDDNTHPHPHTYILAACGNEVGKIPVTEVHATSSIVFYIRNTMNTSIEFNVLTIAITNRVQY